MSNLPTRATPSRTRADNGEKHFIHFLETEVDELVDEWTPEPLGPPLTPEEQSDLASVPVVSGANGPSPKLANMGRQVLNLASYNFTGLAGDETIKVRAIETLRNYGVGSRGPPGAYGTIDVHMNLARDIVDFLSTTASIIYSQGFSTILCVISAFAQRSDIIVADRDVVLFSMRASRLVTQIDMIIGSVANGLNSSGRRLTYHRQHINNTSFVFSAAVSASEGINILHNTPSVLSTLQENVRAIRAVFDRVEAITIPSHAASPTIHIHLRSAVTLSASTSASAKPPNPTIPAPRDAPSRVDHSGAAAARARAVEARPSIRLAVTAALSRKECERAAGVIKAAVVKVLTKRK
ncbi:hypothetical protein EDB92DRAFT_1956086 [Lactarius akahatsu]|uniref:Aminotransferase class I/classII domain-containing protein n=1 Tax=Lactarius akahatsu TaxID=416441 RepID=A0AAD4Q2L1_9AGAM|nr:hypothetical protein EDB92DRAFT_1956086 [Lactarius akahatsu]